MDFEGLPGIKGEEGTPGLPGLPGLEGEQGTVLEGRALWHGGWNLGPSNKRTRVLVLYCCVELRPYNNIVLIKRPIQIIGLGRLTVVIPIKLKVI